MSASMFASMSAPHPILIAGGGICGLACALAFARHNRPSIVLERRAAASEAGAGIQVGPNGTRLLRRLGVADALAPCVGRPDAIALRDGASAAVLARLPLGPWARERWGDPYWVMHRADLHGALLARAMQEPLVDVRTGWDVATVAEAGDAATVTSTAGEALSAPLLVGADGLWSTIRRLAFAAPAPAFAGQTAARAVIPAAAAAALPRDEVGVWLGRDAHVVHYPVRGGAEIAMVVVAPGAGAAAGWGVPCPAGEVAGSVRSFSPQVRDVIAAASGWQRWALHLQPAAPVIVRGRVALAGDAAHAMLPFLAQGAVMAIEDAVVLADTIAAAPDVPAALAAYARARAPRTARVVAAAARNGRIYHMAPPLSWARDAVLRTVPPARLMAGFDWLYGWRPEGRSEVR